MIGSLKGKISYIGEDYVILDVNGVGYKVIGVVGEKEEEKEFFVHTYVREDQLCLYGFDSRDMLRMFELLIEVSGIGPKSALGVLTVASVDQIRRAVMSEDESLLTKVSGIGKRIAKRVVTELKVKLEKEEWSGPIKGGGKESVVEVEVMEALIAMGYTQVQVREAMEEVGAKGDLKDVLSGCLKCLGKKK